MGIFGTLGAEAPSRGVERKTAFPTEDVIKRKGVMGFYLGRR